MIIECDKCHARYQYDPSRFEGKAAKKIRCAKCHEIFEIRNPEAAADPAPASPAPSEVAAAPPAAPAEPRATPRAPDPPRPSSHDDPGDMTISRGRRTYSEPLVDALAAEATSEPEAPPTGEPLQIPEDRRFCLAITEGAEPGKVFRIETPRITIGRAGADVILDDSETSREHAAVEVRASSVRLLDLGSTNGTWVDGQRIAAPIELQDKQEFQVGVTTLMLIVTPNE